MNPLSCSQRAWLRSPCPGPDAFHTSQPASNKVIMSYSNLWFQNPKVSTDQG